MRKLLVFGLLALWTWGCSPSPTVPPVLSGTALAQAAMASGNPCAQGALRATPAAPTATPQAGPHDPLLAPFSSALSPGVDAWRDAIVRVEVTLLEGRVADVQGLVVAQDGKVLTVLPQEFNVASFTVAVPGRGRLPATVAAFEPTVNAVLLSVPAKGLVSAPLVSRELEGLETVSVLSTQPKGGIVSEQTLGQGSVNAPDLLFAVQRQRFFNGRAGGLVVDKDGMPFGLVMRAVEWEGTGFSCRGCGINPAVSAMYISEVLGLMEDATPDRGSIPMGIAHHGDSWVAYRDEPVLRQEIAAPVQRATHVLGRPVQMEGLGGEAWKLVGSFSANGQAGTVIELLYREPQALMDERGRVLGYGRYIVFLRGAPGLPSEVVLCGMDNKHLGAAFEAASGTDEMYRLVEATHAGTWTYAVVETPFPRG